MDYLQVFLDFLCFAVTVIYIGRKPTAFKTTVMICLVSIIEIAFTVQTAHDAGYSVSGMFMNSYTQIKEIYASALQNVDFSQMKSVFQSVASVWPAIFIVEAAVDVFIALLIVWAIRRIAKKNSGWSAFSKLDFPIWSILPFALGCLGIVLSNISGVPYQDEVGNVAIVILVVSVIPLFVQGMAVLKGIMNRKLGLGLQIVIVVVMLAINVLFIVAPLLGAIDLWANFRKLPRGGEGE